ncbi:MAG TPA: hypothetical protein VG146_07445 [Verrucomicrobiae bacterium]|nr:hypothetical protein [Verrucomicrobiae bacterium]
MKSQPTHRRQQLVSLLSIVTALALPLGAKGQSDNFDSGALSARWTKYYADPSLVTFSFPTVGSGKGLRIQTYPFAAAGVPAVAAVAPTNVYSDFYVAVDLVNWVVEDQAVVLFARFTPGGSFGLDGGAGMILNYDAAQAGENAGNRHGGEFQINIVNPGFSATTIAKCEMTLVPGNSYRFIFQGVGTLYTAQVYDMEDLTAPLATLQNYDATYSSGISGILSYSRNGTTGTSDVTVDNYYAAASDPNTATLPAIPHSIPGTPVVKTRFMPAGRWQNFHNPNSGISFTASTFTTGLIKANATKLYLNGVDSSAALAPLPANGSTVSFSAGPGTLVSNAVYSAQIVVQSTDVPPLISTNTFWFDTFSDGYVSSEPVKTIECEDYNYSNGVFQLDPIPVSGNPTNGNPVLIGDNGQGYFDPNDGGFSTMASQGVDIFTPNQLGPSTGWDDYRQNDGVMTGEGIRDEFNSLWPDGTPFAGFLSDGNSTPSGPGWNTNVTSETYDRPNDNTRQKYLDAGLAEYLVIRTHAGDWQNYTRVFNSSSSNYFAFLRVGSWGATTNLLSLVTSDPAQANQTTLNLGAFNIPNQIRKSNFRYIPLLDTNGLGAILNLSGANTLRLTKLGDSSVQSDDRLEVRNYLLLVPAQITVQSSSLAAGPYANDATATVNVGARTITIPMAGAARFYRLGAIVPVRIARISAAGGMVTLKY